MNVLLAMIPAFIWGTTFAVAKFTVPDWPPMLLATLRALPAGFILLAIKPSFPERKDWPILIKLGFINIAAFYTLLFVMALTLPSAIAGVGMMSTPVAAIIFNWVFNKHRPSNSQALFGVVLIVFAWFLFDPSSIPLNPLGLIAMFAAICCIVIGSSITKAQNDRMHWWTVVTWQLIIGGAMLALVTLVQGITNQAQYSAVFNHITLINGLGIVWLLLFNTVLGQLIYVWLLQRMSVVDFTFGGIANPIASIIAGIILLNESFSHQQYLLMMGMIIASLMPQIIKMLGGRFSGKARQ